MPFPVNGRCAVPMMMTYEQFSSRVNELLRLEREDPINPFEGLYDELGLDSIRAFELIIVVEALAAVDLPGVNLPEMYTMQDAYDYYRALVSAEAC
jgi:acyl carrier protein